MNTYICLQTKSVPLTKPTRALLLLPSLLDKSLLGCVCVSYPPHPFSATGRKKREKRQMVETAAVAARLHARGQLSVGQDYVNAGPMGTTFTGRIEDTTRVGDYPAIIPSLSGQGWIYGTSQMMLDPTDPFPNGYKIGDIWGA